MLIYYHALFLRMNIKNVLNNPLTYINLLNHYVLAYVSPQRLASSLYTKYMGGKKINWESPKDLNEKINWLKFYSDTSQWTELADKYKVRQFVKERIGEKYLVPLYGVWDDVDKINFSKLPNSFVLKSNNGAGTVLVVDDKKKINEAEVKQQLRLWLKQKFGLLSAEPHYLKIKPLIIAEELLQEENTHSSSLIDYKIWAFDGQPYATWVCFNRRGFHADTEWHDKGFNFRPEWSIFTDSYRNGQGKINKPENYDEMMWIAAELSKGFPEVRVDLYNIKGKIYFGEMTFTCAGGHMNFYSQEILDKLGSLTQLPNKNK